MISEEKRRANRERVARWREKSGWLGKQRAREASKRWYLRKVEASGRKVRERRGRPRIDESINFTEIPRAQFKEVVEVGVKETHIEAFGPGIDMAYEERSHQDRRSAGELGTVRAAKEGPIEVSEEEEGRARAALAQLEILKARQARGGLNAGVEVELEV